MSILSSFVSIPRQSVYTTKGNIEVTRTADHIDVTTANQVILKEIDNKKGALFSSGFEYPGRYSRWDIGFTNPAMQLSASGNGFSMTAENVRRNILLNAIFRKLREIDVIESNKNKGSGSPKHDIHVSGSRCFTASV